MKNKFGFIGSLLLLALAQVFFVGCGSSDNNSSTSCASGSIWSSTYNTCLAQSSCPSGMGLYNGSCVYANAGSVGSCSTPGYTWNGTACVLTGTGNGTCVPPFVWNGSNCVNGSGSTGQCPWGSTPTSIGCMYQLGGGYTATCVYQTPYYVNGACLSYP